MIAAQVLYLFAIYVFFLLLDPVAAGTSFTRNDRTAHKDTLVCVRTGETHERWGWLYGSKDPIGCLENPEHHKESCLRLTGSSAQHEDCVFSACQEVTIPTIYNGWQHDDAEYCGAISSDTSAVKSSRQLWCYYNLLEKAFCAAFSDDQDKRPKKSSFQCRELKPDWGLDFCYSEKDSIYMKPGPCSEQNILLPDIFEGMTDSLLDEYNQRLNKAVTCPFDSLASAKAEDHRMTKVEWKDCQKNVCYPFRTEFKEFTLTGQRVEAHVIFWDGKLLEVLPFHAQRRENQVCFSYDIKELQMIGYSLDDIQEFHRCASACLDVGSQTELYWGNSTVNGETFVATRTIRITELNGTSLLPTSGEQGIESSTSLATNSESELGSTAVPTSRKGSLWKYCLVASTLGGGFVVISLLLKRRNSQGYENIH